MSLPDDNEEPRLTAQRKRAHDEPLDKHVKEEMKRRVCYSQLPPFGEGRTFPSMAAFREAHKTYAMGHFTDYRVRSSESAASYNKKLENARQRRGLPQDELFIESLVPFSHFTVTLRCKRGLRQKSRAKLTSGNDTITHAKGRKRTNHSAKTYALSKKSRNGKVQRLVRSTNYTECEARICATAQRDPNGVWHVVTSNEVVMHNHKCSQHTIDALGKSALLERPDILSDAAGMMMAGAQASNICDTIFAKYGIRITPKMLANIKRDRLGGKSAIENLKLLLSRLSSFPGSRFLIVNDQLGNVCGLAIQTAGQRLFFERFGQNFQLDFTHNTNNLGFYLGSIMVTSVTGHGVSACDFLCLNQSKAMMTAVLNWLIDKNPGARALVKSVVIDKDFTELAALRETFPETRILLCQFHAIRRFATVVQLKKYNLGPRLRDDVLEILKAMVYVTTTDGFSVLRNRLHDMLIDVSPSFCSYMSDNWYNCRPMWSNCERASVFTALNTTTNRIESAWNRIKKVLGRKLRIDLCVEAIFAYQTAVLAREYDVMNKFASKIVLRSEAHPFVRNALSTVCDFAAEFMDDEWNHYLRHDVGSPDSYRAYPITASQESDPSEQTYAVCRHAAESSTYTVRPTQWSCSCPSHITSGLPCRHLFYFARRNKHLKCFPTDGIALRWRMSETQDFLPRLLAWRSEMGSLRTGLIWTHSTFNSILDPTKFEDAERPQYVKRRVAYFRLQRREVSSVVVMNNLEKRGVLEAEMAGLTQFLLRQSTPKFIELSNGHHTLSVCDIISTLSISHSSLSHHGAASVVAGVYVGIIHAETASWVCFALKSAAHLKGSVGTAWSNSTAFKSFGANKLQILQCWPRHQSRRGQLLVSILERYCFKSWVKK